MYCYMGWNLMTTLSRKKLMIKLCGCRCFVSFEDFVFSVKAASSSVARKTASSRSLRVVFFEQFVNSSIFKLFSWSWRLNAA